MSFEYCDSMSLNIDIISHLKEEFILKLSYIHL